MVGLGAIELASFFYRGHDGRAEHPGVVQLLDVSPGDARLIGVGRKDRRSVLRPFIRPLPIELGRVVRDGKEDLEQPSVADDAWIEDDAHRFGVRRPAAADTLVLRGALVAAGVAGDRAGDPLDVLVDTLD